MKLAVFQTPYMPPSTPPRDVFKWAVDQAIVADQAGFESYWVGEHSLENWESIPNPELVIAAAALETETVKLAAGAHILPNHQPAHLALQSSWLSHVTEGRYIMGVGAGAFPATGALHGIKDFPGRHAMLLEALEIMDLIWKGEAFEFTGKFWNSTLPPEDPDHAYREIRPYGGSIEIGMTALSPNSPSIAMAGQRGYLPLSIYAGMPTLTNHWESYEKNALENGFTPTRADHHVVRDVFVAETDAEARKQVIEGGMGRAWSEYVLPRYKFYNLLGGLIEDGTDPQDVDIEYLADNVFFVGSVETVAEKILAFQERTGGFGTLMPYSYDYSDNPQPWNESMHLLGKEVLPLVNKTAKF